MTAPRLHKTLEGYEATVGRTTYTVHPSADVRTEGRWTMRVKGNDTTAPDWFATLADVRDRLAEYAEAE